MRPERDAAKAPPALPGGRIASILIGRDGVLRSLSGALDAALAWVAHSPTVPPPFRTASSGAVRSLLSATVQMAGRELQALDLVRPDSYPRIRYPMATVMRDGVA